MASARLEQRVAALETEVAQLKRKLEEQETIRPRWEQTAGTFENDPLPVTWMRRFLRSGGSSTISAEHRWSTKSARCFEVLEEEQWTGQPRC